MSIPQVGGSVIEHRDQLTAYLESGCKPRADWRIGTEHEKFGFNLKTHDPLPYAGPCSIRAMLEGLRDAFAWQPVLEAGNLIGLTKDGANISLEPGGQIELSGAPLATLHETCAEVSTHLVEVRTIAQRIGAGFLGLGAAPDWTHDQMPMMPKGRYRLMTEYMQTVGRHGVDMMYRTCTVQVNLDFGSEADMVKKLRVALALQPVATALFANSPFFEGQPLDVLSWRSHLWHDVDADRTGMLPFVFESGFGFDAWADYALDIPMYFVCREGRYLDARGLSFRDFLTGRLAILPGELPTTADWADHLTTIFPEARIKTFLEMRGADSGSWHHICALPAFWVGLLYESSVLDAAWDLAKEMNAATREGLRAAAARDGLRGSCNGFQLRDLARACLDLAAAGLAARRADSPVPVGDSEVVYLDALQAILASDQTPADALLARFHGDWNGQLDRIYDDCSY